MKSRRPCMYHQGQITKYVFLHFIHVEIGGDISTHSPHARQSTNSDIKYVKTNIGGYVIQRNKATVLASISINQINNKIYRCLCCKVGDKQEYDSHIKRLYWLSKTLCNRVLSNRPYLYPSYSS